MRVIIIFFIAFIFISCATTHKYSLQSKCDGMQPGAIYSKMLAVFSLNQYDIITKDETNLYLETSMRVSYAAVPPLKWIIRYDVTEKKFIVYAFTQNLWTSKYDFLNDKEQHGWPNSYWTIRNEFAKICGDRIEIICEDCQDTTKSIHKE